MTMHLSDRRRVEMAMPARLLFRCYGAAMEQVETMNDADRQLLDDLKAACLEPLADMIGTDRPRAVRLGRRIDRLHREVMAEFEDGTVLRAFMIALYWTRDRLDCGDLELVEGSLFDRAITRLLPQLEEAAGGLWDDMHRSATRGAARLHDRLQRAGYFPGRKMS